MSPERLSRQGATEFAVELSLPLGPQSEGPKSGRNREEFDCLAKGIKLWYINDLRWLGRQDSNLGSRDQNPLPYRLATPQFTLSDF
jgi:hypothetical protein